MKKIIALIMTMALLLGAAAVAENAQPAKVYNWADYEEQAKEIGGEFVPAGGIGLKIFAPKGWEQVKEAEVFGLRTAGVEEKDPAFCILSVQVLPVAGDAFVEELKKSNPTVTLAEEQLNGYDVVSYELTDSNGIKAQGVALTSKDGTKTVTFSFAPVTDANAKVVELVKASLQHEEENK